MSATRFTPSQGKTDDPSSDEDDSRLRSAPPSPIVDDSNAPRTNKSAKRSAGERSPTPSWKGFSPSDVPPQKSQRTSSISLDSPLVRRRSSSYAPSIACQALIEQPAAYSAQASRIISPKASRSPSPRRPLKPSPAGLTATEGGRLSSPFQAFDHSDESEGPMPPTSYERAPSSPEPPSSPARQGSSSRIGRPAGARRKKAQSHIPKRVPSLGTTLDDHGSSGGHLRSGDNASRTGLGATSLERSNSFDRIMEELDPTDSNVCNRFEESDISDDDLDDPSFAILPRSRNQYDGPARTSNVASARAPGINAASNKLTQPKTTLSSLPIDHPSSSLLSDVPSSDDEDMQTSASTSTQRYSLRTAPPKSRQQKAHRLSAAVAAGIKPASRFDISTLLKEKENRKKKGLDLEGMAQLSEQAAQWEGGPSASHQELEHAMGQLDQSYAARAAEGLSDEEEDEVPSGRQAAYDGASDFSDDAFDPARHWSETADAEWTRNRGHHGADAHIDIAQVTTILGREEEDESDLRQLSSILARDQTGAQRAHSEAPAAEDPSVSRPCGFWGPNQPLDAPIYSDSVTFLGGKLSQYIIPYSYKRRDSEMLPRDDVLSCSGTSLSDTVRLTFPKWLDANVGPPSTPCWALLCIMEVSIFHESSDVRTSALTSLSEAVQGYKDWLFANGPSKEDSEVIRLLLHRSSTRMRNEGLAEDSHPQEPPRQGRNGASRRNARPAHQQRRAEHLFYFLRTVTCFLRLLLDCQISPLDVAAAQETLRVVLLMACDDRSYGPAKLRDFTEVIELVLCQLPWSEYPAWSQILTSGILAPGQTASAQATLRMLQRFPSTSPRARVLARNQAFHFLFAHLHEQAEPPGHGQLPILPSLRAIADTMASRDPDLNPFYVGTAGARKGANLLELKAKIGLLGIVLSDFALQLCNPPSGSAGPSAEPPGPPGSAGALPRTRKAFQVAVEPYTTDASFMAYFYPDCSASSAGPSTNSAIPRSNLLEPSYARIRQVHRISDALGAISSGISENRGGLDADDEPGNNPLDKGRVKDAIQRLSISLKHQTHFYTGHRPGVDAPMRDEDEDEDDDDRDGGGDNSLSNDSGAGSAGITAGPAPIGKHNGAGTATPHTKARPRPRASVPRASDQSDLTQYFTPPKR